MTVSSSTGRQRYEGNGATIVFSTVFEFLDNTHITVIHTDADGVETTWAENTQYTLTGAATSAAGEITVSTTPTDYTPAAGEYLTIIRSIPPTQELPGSTLTTLSGGDMENALDRLTMIAQQGAEVLSRAIVASVGYVGDIPTATEIIDASVAAASSEAERAAMQSPTMAAGSTGESAAVGPTQASTTMSTTEIGYLRCQMSGSVCRPISRMPKALGPRVKMSATPGIS